MGREIILPVAVDNSKERRNFRGFLRSFYNRLSVDYNDTKLWFSKEEDGWYYRTGNVQAWLEKMLVLDLCYVSFTYMILPNTYIIRVKRFPLV